MYPTAPSPSKKRPQTPKEPLDESNAPLSPGMAVEARFRGRGKVYKGKLLQHAGVTRTIDGVAAPLVPLVVPVSDLVALLSGSALVRTTAELQAGAKATGEGPAGDLLDDWMRQRFNAFALKFSDAS